MLRRRTARFDDRWDQHGVFDPDRTYLIASVQRSGSTLLTSAFRATGRLGVPWEYFTRDSIGYLGPLFGVLPVTVRGEVRRLRRRLRGDGPWVHPDELSPAVMSEFVGALQRIRTTPNGVFGAKLQYSELRAIRRDVDVDLLDLLQPRRIIFLTRRDHLRQAVSWFRAVELGLWNTRRPPDPAPMPPAFDKSAIEALVVQIEVAEAGWNEALSRCGAEVHTVTYEELDADYEGVMAACFAFLGEPDTPVPPRGLYRLADDVTEEWVVRLRGTPSS